MSPQQTIAHYRITAKLGEGGMGEVWRATDTKLNREVAIKILPAAFANDLQRMARFQREAELLAALNHPNIASIYGIEEGSLILELVEGEDLHGPLPVKTALTYARQIAVALEAAHEKGIIHRDLKPANIKVTGDGVVKLLDFGLGKADETASGQIPGSDQRPTLSPTISLAMTQAGAILGTAAYMSPEQARGKTADRRSDIWAFGVVLYEMLTGTTLFGGETVTDTLASVVKEAPDWKALPVGTPLGIRRLLDRCLHKDPKMRLQAIGEARIAIDEQEPAPGPSTGASLVAERWLVLAMIAITLVATVCAGTLWLGRPSAAPAIGPVRMLLSLPEGVTDPVSLATPQAVPSPDGRFIAFAAREGSGTRQTLWIRRLDSLSARRLDKTEDANYPFWSPDSRFIAYFTLDKLKRIAVDGSSAPQTICSLPLGDSTITSPGDGGTWNRDGVIVFGSRTGQPLTRVAASGGVPMPVTAFDKTAGERVHSWPQFLPDGHHLIYFAQGATPQQNGVYVQALGDTKRTLVTRNLSRAAWAAPGYLFFVREATLLAQRINPRTFQLEGEAMAIAQEVIENAANGRSAFAVSESGVLVYRSGVGAIEDRQLVWIDRDGKRVGSLGKVDAYSNLLLLSPDEKSVAVTVRTSIREGYIDILDLATGPPTRMTHDAASSLLLGAWSPDSRRIAVVDARLSAIQELDVASGKITTLSHEPGLFVEDWTPDGRALLCRTRKTKDGLLLLPLSGDGKPQRVTDLPHLQFGFQFSPDGQWVVYTDSGAGEEAFVASFPSFAVRKQVSNGGGHFPTWQKDGKAVFFWSFDNSMMMADIRTGAELELGKPRALFRWGAGTPRSGSAFAVSKDQRFLLAEPVSRTPPQNVVILNWLSGFPSR